MVLKEVIKSTICSYFNNEIDSSSVIIENPKERKLGDLAQRIGQGDNVRIERKWWNDKIIDILRERSKRG